MQHPLFYFTGQSFRKEVGWLPLPAQLRVCRSLYKAQAFRGAALCRDSRHGLPGYRDRRDFDRDCHDSYFHHGFRCSDDRDLIFLSIGCHIGRLKAEDVDLCLK